MAIFVPLGLGHALYQNGINIKLLVFGAEPFLMSQI